MAKKLDPRLIEILAKYDEENPPDPGPTMDDDLWAITQLKARYFRTMDSKDWAGMRQVFTDDVVMDTSEAGGSNVPSRYTTASGGLVEITPPLLTTS